MNRGRDGDTIKWSDPSLYTQEHDRQRTTNNGVKSFSRSNFFAIIEVWGVVINISKGVLEGSVCHANHGPNIF